MCYDDTAFSNFYNTFCNFIEFRCIVKHFAIYACEIYHKRLYFSFGVYKAYKLINNFVAIESVNGYFSDAFFVEFSTGGFYVEYCVNA